MNPIWEQGKNKDIGYEFDHLLARFIQICREHQVTGRAKSFAFIFYDIHNESFSSVINDGDTFTRLDRLSGENLTVFYLDQNSISLIDNFNESFGRLFDVPADTRLPYILFFNFNNDDVDRIIINEIRGSRDVFIYQSLYQVIADNIEQIKSPKRPPAQSWQRIGHTLYRAVPKVFLEKGIEYLVVSAGDSLKHLLS